MPETADQLEVFSISGVDRGTNGTGIHGNQAIGDNMEKL